MKINIRVSWPAWLGINSTAEIISMVWADLWYNVLTDLEYESRIKWWTNWFDINISNESKSISKYVDILIVFSYDAIIKSLRYLKTGAIIITNKKFSIKIEEKVIKELEKKQVKIFDIEINDKYDNTYLLWVLTKLLNIPFEIIEKKLERAFAKKWEEIVEKNKDIIKEIIKNYDFNWYKSTVELNQISEKKEFSYWNKLIAYWAIEGWLEFYSAYPMTPASSILTEVINSKRVTYLQAEDEIAVINSALWASFTWARSMVWTSGGWFALMAEALSFAIQAEISVVVVLSQRAGPSTWTPTYHEQWDINFALNPTFWDFEHIVLTPSTLEEAYYFSWLALNLADKYQMVVLLLVDKQLSELHGTVEKLEAPKINRGKMLDNPQDDYKRYECTDDW